MQLGIKVILLVCLKAVVVYMVIQLILLADLAYVTSCKSILGLCLEVYRLVVQRTEICTIVTINIELVVNKLLALVGLAS